MSTRERAWLIEFVEGCPHTATVESAMLRLDEGSEHFVYLAPDGTEVVKVTRPGIYGDRYFVEGGRVFQRRCTPGDYLVRLALLEAHFGFSQRVLGITDAGQVVSSQRFVAGELPTQEDVDDFLRRAGMEPVRQDCWLWKRPAPDSESEIWIGDARADNFVKTADGIVPIDLRMWIKRGIDTA